MIDSSTRTFFIAGVKFRPDWERTALSLQRGFEADLRLPIDLQLVGEPKNEFDRYAVKVLLPNGGGATALLGYVPKPLNIDIWALRDAGWKPVAKLVEFEPDGTPWNMYKVQVTFDQKTP